MRRGLQRHRSLERSSGRQGHRGRIAVTRDEFRQLEFGEFRRDLLEAIAIGIPAQERALGGRIDRMAIVRDDEARNDDFQILGIALDRDPRTDAAVIVGEIGGSMEEAAADYAGGMTKPVVAFVAGAASPPGKKMGHAGAIVIGSGGSYASKRKALEGAGVMVIDTPGNIAGALALRLVTAAVAD